MSIPLLIVGSYPPPQGGCSVHVQRLAKLMSDEFNVEVLDLYGKGSCSSGDIRVRRFDGNIFARGARAVNRLRRVKNGIVHFHVSAMRRFIFLGFIFVALIKSKVGVVLTIHSGSFVGNYRSSSQLWRAIFRRLVRRFDKLIAVNHQQKVLLEECGVPTSRICIIPAYFPPVPESTNTTDKVLSDIHYSDRKLIVLSGYGVPLYGYEKILEVLEKDDDLRSRLSLVVCTYNTFDESYMDKIERRASLLGSIRIVRNLTPEEFAFVLSKADIYVRATDRDGDAVAIREAGHFSVPVIASDCVERPKGVRLFNRDDPHSLAEAFKHVLDNSSIGQLSTSDESGYGTLLRQLYMDLNHETSL